MNLSNPEALFWAVLAIPVALLFLLKVRVRRVPVSTGLFWRQIFEEILAVADGKKTKSEINGVGEEEFAPWSIGPTL